MSTEEIKALEKGLEFYRQLKGEKDGSVTINVEPIPFAGMVTIIEPKYKDLTDVEIYEVFKGCVFEGGFCKYEFARAILRKAKNAT